MLKKSTNLHFCEKIGEIAPLGKTFPARADLNDEVL